MGSFWQEWQHGDRGHKGWTNRNAALSTGNIYGLVPVDGGGSREMDVPQPVGEYAVSCLALSAIGHALG